jgi:hypothetical protein
MPSTTRMLNANSLTSFLRRSSRTLLSARSCSDRSATRFSVPSASDLLDPARYRQQRQVDLCKSLQQSARAITPPGRRPRASCSAAKIGRDPERHRQAPRKRFIVVPETEENERLNSSLVKALSAGDQMTARFSSANSSISYFTGKLWIATNHLKPTITDHSKGFWERLKLVPFSQDIPPDKVIKSDDLMEQLMAKLRRSSPGRSRAAATISSSTVSTSGGDPGGDRRVSTRAGFDRAVLEECCETLIEARARAPDEYHQSEPLPRFERGPVPGL